MSPVGYPSSEDDRCTYPDDDCTPDELASWFFRRARLWGYAADSCLKVCPEKEDHNLHRKIYHKFQSSGQVMGMLAKKGLFHRRD